MVYLMWIWALFWCASTVFSALVISNIVTQLSTPWVGKWLMPRLTTTWLSRGGGMPSVLSCFHGVVDNRERLGLRFVIVSWNRLPLNGVDVLLVPWEGDGTKYGAIRWFVKCYA